MGGGGCGTGEVFRDLGLGILILIFNFLCGAGIREKKILKPAARPAPHGLVKIQSIPVKQTLKLAFLGAGWGGECGFLLTPTLSVHKKMR